MKKQVVLVSALFLVCVVLQAQTWDQPINIIGPYAGTGGRFGEYPKLLVVNGNPAIAAYDATRGNLLFIRATNASGTAWGTPVPLNIPGFKERESTLLCLFASIMCQFSQI